MNGHFGTGRKYRARIRAGRAGHPWQDPAASHTEPIQW
jgi:hypothetical protein